MTTFDDHPAFVLLPRPETVPTALGVIRALGRRGVQVIAASSDCRCLSCASGYVRERPVCPYPADHCAAFVDRQLQADYSISPGPTEGGSAGDVKRWLKTAGRLP